MERGDHWSTLKCSGGAHDKTIINRVMLRFRPIAPKPVAGDSGSGESMLKSKNLVVTSKRTKRRYVRVCKKNNRKKRILDEAKEDNGGNKGFVTLQLMPEKADLRESIVVERSWDLDRALGFNNYRFQDPPSLCLTLKKMVAADQAEIMGLSLSNPGRRRKRTTVVESSLVVESVTETCIDEGEMGNCTDVEKMKNLEKDTCPGLVSDGLNRVSWVNQAYKNMVGLKEIDDNGEEEEEERAETAVGLVVKDGLVFPRGAFSCRVRLSYVDGKGKKCSKTVPCDAWRLSSGGIIWRLDVNAALSLGL
ncbi:DIG-like 4 [Hibiscus trionum]|uniref:DIG-like 4 n=1 Tax=Hibiscus trionum TaxID=183268 RepID=A0A9W7IDE2_HIBTR|nr:DIG-like 4 [Hibiscus trionum]